MSNNEDDNMNERDTPDPLKKWREEIYLPWSVNDSEQVVDRDGDPIDERHQIEAKMLMAGAEGLLDAAIAACNELNRYQRPREGDAYSALVKSIEAVLGPKLAGEVLI